MWQISWSRRRQESETKAKGVRKGPSLPGWEVHFVLDSVFFPVGTQQDGAAVFYHTGVAAQVRGRFFRAEIPKFNIFSDEVVGAAGFAMPARIVPRTADRRNVFQPRRFGRKHLEFLTIAKFMSLAGALDAEQAVFARHRGAPVFPIPVDSADVADIGRDSGHGSDEQVVLATAAEVESEASFGQASKEQGRSHLYIVKDWCKFSLRDVFHKKFEHRLVGGRADRIRALDPCIATQFDSEGGILTGEEVVRRAGINFQNEEVFGDGSMFEDTRGKKFVGIGDQA